MQMLSFQEVKLDSLPLNWVGLWRGKIVTLLLKKSQLAGTTLTKWSRIKLPFTSHVTIMCPSYHMRDPWHNEKSMSPLWYFPPQTYNRKLIMQKAWDKPKLRKILCNIWPVLFEMIKVMKARTHWEAVQSRED